MKKYHAFTLIALLTVSAAISAFKPNDDQDGKASVVIVRVFIAPNITLSNIQIYRGEAKVEEVKLAKLSADSQYLNWQVVTGTLNKLVNEGYRISSSSVNGENTIYATFVLTK